jgi:hypothetical protein
MLLSIANSRPRNLESVRAQSLFPENIQSGAANIIAFIQEYYNYINTSGLPSAEIGSIITDKDIDVVSNNYLDSIGNLIANNIPNSTSLDKVALYKIIVKYYNTRGSEDSITAFFKIFLNETVSIFYPKEYLFAPSSGKINWDPYDVPPLERTTPPVNGVADTITVNNSGLENVIIADNDNSILTLSDTTALTLNPVLASEGVTINIPTLTYTGSYNGRFAYTSTGTLTNLLQQQYALYWNGAVGADPSSIEARWILRGGGGKTLAFGGDLYDDVTGNSVVFDTLVESGIQDGRPFYTSTTNPLQKCYWSSAAVRWILSIDQGGYTLTWISDTDESFYTPDLVPEWFENEDAIGNPTLSFTGTNAGYWTPNQRPLGNNPTARIGTYIPVIMSTVGTAVLALIDGDTNATQPTNGNLYARTGTFPNRTVYKCVDDGSLPGHSIIWQLQTEPEWQYEDHKGFASDSYKIQDSNYWQNYSYDIQSNSDASVWRNAFLKFVHPAGLKLFTSLLLEIQSLNVWDSFISYELTNLQDRYSWLSALNPTDTYQRHTPKYQPGWLSIGNLEYIFTALFAEGTISLSREVIMVFQFILASVYSERQLVSQEYDLNGIKFRDPSCLGDGFLGSDRTISSMINSGLATVIVSSVIGSGAAGPVASVTILNAGVGYIVGTGKVTTGGSGSNFALNITAVDTNGGITSISTPLNTAGSNYKVGDILTLTNGAFNYLHSYAYKMLNVASIVRSGPNTSKATTDAGGTGCTLNIVTIGTGGAITSLAGAPTVAGTGYAVGDILTISGGTVDNLAQAIVTTISGGGAKGPVTAVLLMTAGLGYTTGTGKATSSVVGTGCILSIAAVGAGGAITSLVTKPTVAGAGYTVGDILTISGGTAGNLATATVTATGYSGSVTAVSILAAGLGYTKSNDTTQTDLITNYLLV